MALLSSLSRRLIAPSSRLVAPLGATLSFSSPATKCVVVNSIGVDRPGIVADVTKIVTDRGGNVGESHSKLLGGHFSLMMLVDIASSEMEGLHKQLQTGVTGMTTSCHDAVDPKKAGVSPRVGCEWTTCHN
ncbi:hypothetical protein ACHAWF_004147 [Thalassiosira exigua]